MLRVVFAVLLGLGLWTVSGNRVTADDEKEQQTRPARTVDAEKEQVEIEIKRVKRDADRTGESKEGETRKQTLNQREAAIKELRVYLEKLKAQQRKLEKSDDAEARKKIGIQIRSTTAKLEDLQASFRKEGIERKEQRGEREVHPEIRAARNQLEHMRAAIKHLKEAGLKEYAQAVGQRAEKLQATIHRSLDRGREGDERRRDQDVASTVEHAQRGSEADRWHAQLKRAFGAYDKNKDGKVTAEEFIAVLGGKDNPKVRAVAARQFDIADRDQDKSVSFEEFLVAGKHRPGGGESRDRRDGDRDRLDRDRRGSDRKEVKRDVKRERSPRREGAGNPERELNQAILQIRKELEELRKEVRLLRGERGERREGSEDRGERDDG